MHFFPTIIAAFLKTISYVSQMAGAMSDIPILKNAFRHILLEERYKHNLTQIELAQKSGLTRQSISVFESGHAIPTLLSLLRLAKALNMSSSDFIYILTTKAKLYGFKY